MHYTGVTAKHCVATSFGQFEIFAEWQLDKSFSFAVGVLDSALV